MEAYGSLRAREVIQLTEAWSEMTFDLNFKAQVGRNALIWRKKKYRWGGNVLALRRASGFITSVKCHRSIHVKVIETVGYVILPGIEKRFCGIWSSYELRRCLRKKKIIKSRSKSECFRTYTEFKRKNDIHCFLKLTNDINITEAESNVNPLIINMLCNTSL